MRLVLFFKAPKRGSSFKGGDYALVHGDKARRWHRRNQGWVAEALAIRKVASRVYPLGIPVFKTLAALLKGDYSDRVKELEEVAEKMHGRDTRKALKEIQDWIGYRIVVPGLSSIPDVDRAMQQLNHPDIRVIARQNKIAKPNKTGYTGAIHYDIEVGGVPGEVQIRPPLIEHLANWEHGAIYKAWKRGADEARWIKRHTEDTVQPYVVALYLWALRWEQGLKGPLPEAPPAMRKKGLEYKPPVLE